MAENFDFRDLFVLDLANNHQGSVEHGLDIIRGVAEAAKRHNIRAGVKFQFRQMKSFVHPDHMDNKEHKHISRFLSTELSPAQYQILLDEVKKHDMVSICTPFDEASVSIISDMKFDIMKVASCSANDWPLLEDIAASGLPVIFSTGGLDLNDIDSLAVFFEHRGTDFAIMHCVSIYPIPDPQFQLNQIDKLRERFPGTTIGWSTHEVPDDTDPVIAAVAKGARMFERHVGVETDEIKLNTYSSTPEQVDKWFAAYNRAKILCGADERPASVDVERESIDSLRRGVYAKRTLKQGAKLSRSDIYFAIPFNDGQLESGLAPVGENEDVVLLQDVKADEPIMSEHVRLAENPDYQIIKKAVHDVKAMLNEARIALNSEFGVEYSHHYGISNFRETGAVIIECINREYCKKLVIQLPGQRHPSHYHARKEETFQVLHGVLHTEVDGHDHTLHPGETILVQPGVWHSFRSDTGVIFEEVSTTHYNNDSFYKDKAINQLKRTERKTVVDHWGRFQVQPDTEPSVDQPEE
jgi:sialic acid synthase SpsE/D-lyxose ketol-isomerase